MSQGTCTREHREYAAAIVVGPVEYDCFFFVSLILIGIFSKAILAEIYPYLLIMSFVTAGVAWYLHRKRKSIPVTGEEAEEEDSSNPLEFKVALIFAPIRKVC